MQMTHLDSIAATDTVNRSTAAVVSLLRIYKMFITAAVIRHRSVGFRYAHSDILAAVIGRCLMADKRLKITRYLSLINDCS